MADRVELHVSIASALLGAVGLVTCDVTTPNGTTYRTRVGASAVHAGPIAAVIGLTGAREAVAIWPIGFEHAPLILQSGMYRVRWEVPSPSLLGGAFGHRVVHDVFRIEPRTRT